MFYLRLRLIALLMAVAVLVPSTAMASIVYVCQMTGKAGPRCCCTAGAHGQTDEHEQQGFERPACCQANVAHAETAPAVPQAPFADIPAAALREVVPVLSVERGRDVTVAFRVHGARAPPNRGVPAYLDNCSFLI